MKKRVFIIGYFGYESGKLDGQTVKTRNTYELIRKCGRDAYELKYYDTEKFKASKISIFGILKNTAWCDTLIIIPERNSLMYIFPAVYLLSKVFGFDIVHNAIGSKQAEFFRTKKHFRRMYVSMAKNVKAFLVEVGKVEKELRSEFGFTNTGISRNFRSHEFTPRIANRNKGLKIVFISRIMPLKGSETVFAISEYLNRHYPGGDVTIDFYGPVCEGREHFFESVESDPLLAYKGELAPDDIYGVMNGYDLLLLPTRRYYEEGFPGAVLDAYIAGIPVLVSEWAYSDEFVADGKTGFIHDMDDTEGFCRSIDLLYTDRDRLLEMKRNAWEESRKYSEDTAWNELESLL